MIFNKKKYKGKLGKFTYDKREYLINDGCLEYIGKSNKPSYLNGCVDCSYMFAFRKDLEVIDLSGWDLSNIIRTNSMFSNCINLKEIIGIEKLDLSNVEDAAYMYWMCTKLVK